MNRLLRNRSSAGVCSVMEDGIARRREGATLPAKGGDRRYAWKGRPSVRAEEWQNGRAAHRIISDAPLVPSTLGGTARCLLTGRLAVARARDERVRRVDADTAREARQLAVRVRRQPGTGVDRDLRHADARR